MSFYIFFTVEAVQNIWTSSCVHTWKLCYRCLCSLQLCLKAASVVPVSQWWDEWCCRRPVTVRTLHRTVPHSRQIVISGIWGFSAGTELVRAPAAAQPFPHHSLHYYTVIFIKPVKLIQQSKRTVRSVKIYSTEVWSSEGDWITGYFRAR